MVRPFLMSLVVLGLFTGSANAQQTTLEAGRLRAQLLGGRQFAFYCAGTGSPTVILDAGLGADARAWSRVQPVIAQTTRACAFDRPGYGASDEGPGPRNATRIVADLEAGLEAAGIAGPYVLVGHSMGGYNMRLFANLHSDDVVGMVLVDPSIDGNEAPLRAVSPAFARSMADFQATAGKCIRATAEGRMTPGDPLFAECGSPPPGSPLANTALARTALSEQESLEDSSRQVLASEPVSSALPLIVLTAGGQFGPEAGFPETERAALSTVIRENHGAIAARSSNGEHRVIDGAPHMIQMARPDAVTDAVLEVLRAAPTSRAARE